MPADSKNSNSSSERSEVPYKHHRIYFEAEKASSPFYMTDLSITVRLILRRTYNRMRQYI